MDNSYRYLCPLRFRIEVIVDDEADQARFVIFDREATKLTNVLAEDLITFEVYFNLYFFNDCYNCVATDCHTKLCVGLTTFTKQSKQSPHMLTRTDWKKIYISDTSYTI